MITLKKGDYVKMTSEFKKLAKKDSGEHIKEFGNCVGVIIGKTFPESLDPNAPELDVRWKPSNLRYGYHPEDLELVKIIKIKQKRK